MGLEAGRIRSPDKTSMNLIIEAVKIGPNDYGILVNKVPKPTKAMLEREPDASKFFTLINEGTVGTNFILICPKISELEDQENAWTPPSDEILGFIQRIPKIGIDPNQVEPLQFDQYGSMMEKLNKQLDDLIQDKQKLQTRYEEISQQLREAESTRQRPQGFWEGLGEFMGTIIPPIKWITAAVTK